MKTLVIIGSGAIAQATLMAIAKKRKTRFDCILIGRNPKTTTDVAQFVRNKHGLDVETHFCDVHDVKGLASILALHAGCVVANLATPDTHIAVMSACLETGCHYLDTALYEAMDDFNVEPPWYGPEHTLAAAFSRKCLTSILSIGFDPGVVNTFCAKAAREDFDNIKTIDIICANGGNHGYYFATNFNAAVNLKELCEETSYRKAGTWHIAPAFSRQKDFDLPGIGRQSLFSVGHEEVHSLARLFPEAEIEFWMRIGSAFREVLEVLNKLGMLSRDKIRVREADVAPIDMLTALLPHPNALAERYKGKVCVGSLISGTKNGTRSSRFYHCICDHEDCIRDTGSHVTLFTTAIPVIAAAELILDGSWNAGRMAHPEELNPDPFLSTITEMGLPWKVIETDLNPQPIGQSEPA